jgi:hypothetical protein
MQPTEMFRIDIPALVRDCGDGRSAAKLLTRAAQGVRHRSLPAAFLGPARGIVHAGQS